MNKPKWEHAPEWARYLCQDGDGRWVWFEFKPQKSKIHPAWIQGKICRWEFAKEDSFVPGWTATLERRP